MIFQIIIIFITLSSLLIISERIGPKVAGIISGLPTGSAITILVIGINNGAEFAGISALKNLSMVPVLMLLLITFSLLGRYYAGYFSSLITVIGSIVAFSACGYIVYTANVDWRISVFISAICAILTHRLFLKMTITSKSKINHSRIGVIFIRSAIATSLIGFLIYFSNFMGPEITGIVSAFPMTLMPLLIITRHTHGLEPTLSIIKNVPRGLISLIVYMICVFYTFSHIGVIFGTILATLFSGITLIIFFKIEKTLMKPNKIK